WKIYPKFPIARSKGTFILRVQVSDMLTGRPLSKAAVELFVNHTLRSSAFSGDGGDARLHVPFHAGLPVAVATSKQGFISALLLWETSRKPSESKIKSRVVQGAVRGPFVAPGLVLSAINLSYLTVPRLTSDQGDSLNTLGFVSVELSPVAAVSVRLFSGDVELNVSGPIQISLNVPESRGLQESDVVPAWFFSRTTGGWMRRGLGKMTLVDGKLMWTFTAPHLGYWIAAPVTSSRGRFSLQMCLSPVKRTQQDQIKNYKLRVHSHQPCLVRFSPTLIHLSVGSTDLNSLAI
uniref:FAM171 N-terminal domain-containing protein n=1 Tax=Xiphophorus couchianus TaxID=32473 RepID=A0A3B5MEJ9_9TELE